MGCSSSNEPALETVDLVHPLSQIQRCDRLLCGYIRVIDVKQTIPDDIKKICKMYLDATMIKSQTEIEKENKIHDQYKIAIFGDVAVGKTSTMYRFVTGGWLGDDPQYYERGCFQGPTYRKYFEVDDDPVLADIEDTSGQQDFDFMIHRIIKNNNAFLLVYSVEKFRSLRCVQYLFDQICEIYEENLPPLLLVANKCDLDNQRKITYDEGKQVANKLCCPFVEISAKENVKVDEAFNILIRKARHIVDLDIKL